MNDESFKQKLKVLLNEIYEGEEERIVDALLKKCADVKNQLKEVPRREGLFSEKDIMLIAYPDHLQSEEKTPLRTLASFCNHELCDAFSMLHLLPFYPSTSDDGFSVQDYKQVDEAYGSWSDLKSFNFALMFDGVFNHCSSQSPWFTSWIKEDPQFHDYFIAFQDQEVDEGLAVDLKKVTRPRTHPLLTRFERGDELMHVWTTFSPDQVDVNFARPEVLQSIIDAYLFYFICGAYIIRVDAVPFLWKELGTSCSHHPKTHLLVQVLRLLADYLDKNYLVITESNVPFKENISYFGSGNNEAHIVYNFSLPPLLATSYFLESAELLQEWSPSLKAVNEKTTFLNMTATHDGIGVRGIEGIVSEKVQEDFFVSIQHKGGLINYREKDGEKQPYELNITWSNLLYDESLSEELNVRKFVGSQLVMASLPGIPAFYFSSLFAAKNWQEGVKQSGQNRRINREKFKLEEQVKKISNASCYSGMVFNELKRSLKVRKGYRAFSPLAQKEDINLHPKIWSFFRVFKGERPVLVLLNLSAQDIEVDLPEFNQQIPRKTYDLLGEKYKTHRSTELKAYELKWLEYQQ